MTPPSQISEFKINTGLNLLDFARDYSISGVKVTFFAFNGSRKTKDFLQSLPVVEGSQTSFRVMGLNGLFITKALLPEQRQKSRDLFDLMFLLKHCGFTMEELLDAAENYSKSQSKDITISALLGETPVDELQDQGLRAIGEGISLNEIYLFFRAEITQYLEKTVSTAFKEQS